MIIGIHSLAALRRERTGVEEYAFQLLKNLAMLEESKKHRFLLYTPFLDAGAPEELAFPENFRVNVLRFPVMWTQIRLALEMALRKPDALFIPAHVLPLIHPSNAIVAVHDVAYEHFPEMYSPFQRRYLRGTTTYALLKAKKIIVPSENTKSDLIQFYDAPQKKIQVIYHGAPAFACPEESPPLSQPYLLSLGRIEKKKNIEGLIEAFERVKATYGLPHQLVLAGGPGYGFKEIARKIDHSPVKREIMLTGHLPNKRKNVFLKFADMLAFPSFYEGFGFPALEAQAAGVPVVASNVSCIPEIAGDGALFFDPQNHTQLAEAIYQVAGKSELRRSLIQRGFENIKRFSWEKCAKETLETILRY